MKKSSLLLFSCLVTASVAEANVDSEGGSGGGQIIAEGTPEQIAKQDVSHTGHFLAPLLARGKRATKR